MRNSRGLTLIELLMVIVVGGIVFTNIALFTASQAKSLIAMRDRASASYLAESKIARMNNMPFAQLVSQTETDTAFPQYQIVTSVSLVTGLPDGGDGVIAIRRIDVEVHHNEIEWINPLVHLTTYKEKNVEFGEWL